MRKKSRHAVSESLGQTADMKPEGGAGSNLQSKSKGKYPLNTEPPSDRNTFAHRVALIWQREPEPRCKFLCKSRSREANTFSFRIRFLSV